MVEIVIGDVHARTDALRTLLRVVGALDEQGRRSRGCWVVQIGDLLDRRATDGANLATARLAATAVDVVLAGNHELRMLSEPAGGGRAALATLAASGWPHAAFACGDWLVTHAGVHPELARGLPTVATECAAEINDRWHRRGLGNGVDPLFDWRGPARGGQAPCGGIFWAHPAEWRKATKKASWGQVSGHVPQPQPRLLPGRRWAIDLGARGGRLAALVRCSAESRWRPVVVRAADERDMIGAPTRKRVAA
ncbi:MAG: metallophosphoesterase [Solirubrobacteraceae bacterium]